jgi:Bacterial Ig domain
MTYRVRMHPNGGPPDPEHEPSGHIASISISQPQNGTVLTGPSAGVAINVQGIVEMKGDPKELRGIDVYVDRNLVGSANKGPDGVSWTFTTAVLPPGPHTIGAIALPNPRPNAFSKSVEVGIRIDVITGAPATAPSAGLEVIEPRDGQVVYVATGDFKVDFRGFAAPSNLSYQLTEVLI